ncbi:Reversal of Tor2 lethality [Malassezia pachydermatis]
MRLSHLMGQVWACLLSLLLFVSTVRAQNKPYSGVADTLIEGTWSSGTGAVTTGPEFYNLVNNTFNVPSVPGQAYSFHMINKTHGYWEQALYIIQSNGMCLMYSHFLGTRPLGCYTAQLIWQHGNYTIFPDTSIRLDPFTADGRMQLLDTCGTNPNKIYYYSQYVFMILY